jgi:hypothetical protein
LPLHIETNESDRNQISITSSHCSYLKAQDVILSTALVNVFGKPLQLRALLNSASQPSFITENTADKLKLSFAHINVPVTGINESISTAKKLVELKIHSNRAAFSATLITERLLIVAINLSNFTVPPNIKLADPQFNVRVCSEINLLIGSDLFYFRRHNWVGQLEVTIMVRKNPQRFARFLKSKTISRNFGKRKNLTRVQV